MPDISNQLKALRRERGITEAQLAQTVGSTEDKIQQYEQGRDKPSYDTLMTLADYFGVTLDHLTGRRELDFQLVRDQIQDEEGTHTAYGIAVLSEGETKLRVHDISTSLTFVERLVERCSAHHAALPHVMDVIQDAVESRGIPT